MRWPTLDQKERIFAKLGHTPTVEQWPVHRSTAEIIIVGGGERAGKSNTAAMEGLGRLLWCGGYPIFLVGEKYERCVPEFDYLVENLPQLLHPKIGYKVSRPADGQQRCTIKIPDLKINIMTVSAVKGMTAVRATGQAPKLIILCEAGLLSYSVFLASLGRVSEARGVVIATGSFPDDTGWYAQKYEEYQGPNEDGGESFSIPSWSNTVIYPGGEQDPQILKIKARYPHLDYLRFIGAEPQPPATLVYPEFRYATHVKQEVGFQEEEPVWLAVDPGYRGAYAVIAYQFIAPYIWAVDEVYRWAAEHGSGAYGEAVIEACMERPWWGNVVDGVIDVAALQHHAAQSQAELWAAKTEMALKWRKVPPFAGRQRLRTFLTDPASGEPLLLLSTLCENFAREFTRYQFREIVDGQPVSEEPIDRDNHAIKATEYLLYYLYGPVDWPEREGVPPRRESQFDKVYRRKRDDRTKGRLYGE